MPLVANVLADKLEDPSEIRIRLVEQVTGMVRWRESVLWMASQGVTDIVEIGAGKVLTGMAKRIDRSLKGNAVGTPEEIAAFLETL